MKPPQKYQAMNRLYYNYVIKCRESISCNYRQYETCQGVNCPYFGDIETCIESVDLSKQYKENKLKIDLIYL